MPNEENNQEVQNQAEVVLTEAEQQAQHDQAMIDKVDANDAQTEGELQTDQEKMLAGKYKTVEELEKAYEHLQNKLGSSDEEEEEEEEEEAPQAESGKEEAEIIAAEAGIDYIAMESEYQELGGLSKETYEALADAGIPETMVDAYIAGQEALTQTTITKMYGIAGGEQTYNDMIGWAQDTLSESEIDAFNSSLINEGTSEFAINGLYARYSAEKGPNLVKGSTTNAASGGFASTQEMMVEMANPRYKKDPAFRAEVQRRVAISSF
jgi:hypothetical protein